MGLTAASHIGPYEIVAPLGAGGMGEVYRARDPRLGRDVAIKILRSDVGDRRRFEVEARAASSLNHANIVTIHDIGEQDGAPYIVFELLEGDSLRTLLAAGAMPVRRLLDIAVQIAAGLAAAHAQHITHRDLKPENVMVLRDGQVKILDFGLAKATTPDDTDSETRTARGLLLGTLAYMSPEQAQGREMDFRTDQFSFGAMIYEMATGVPAFKRGDRVSTMSAVVREEPAPVASANPLIPAPVRWVVDRCLAKEPSQRYASTADLHHQLRDIREHLSEVFSSDASLQTLEAPRLAARYRKYSVVAAMALALVVGGFFTAVALIKHGSDPRNYRYTPFAVEAADETEPAWSTDGKALAYTAVVNGLSQVFARKLDSLVPALVTSARTICRFPFWSVDGSRIYYWSAAKLWSVAAVGGESREEIPDIMPAAPPATISPDGKTIAFFRNDGRQGTVRLMTLPAGATTLYDRTPFPARFRLAGGMRFSPNGKTLLVWLVRDLEKGAELWLLPHPQGEPRRVETKLLSAFRVLGVSWTEDNRHVAVATEAVPGSGSHVYILDTRSGDAEPVTMGTGEEREPAVSPDGNRMAFASGGVDTDLMEVSVDGAHVTPLLSTPRNERAADWAPSGWQYAYTSNATGVPEIWLRSTAESWSMPIVRDSPEGQLGYASPRFSPDGQKLAYVRAGAKHIIWISNLSGGVTVPLEQESADQHAPAWSPDGLWIAYIRYVGSKWEIARASSSGGVQSVPIADGGDAASKLEWSPTGNWIAFNQGDELKVVSPAAGAPRTIYRGARTFTFARDGSTIYVVRRGKERKWEMVSVRVPDGVESTPVLLNLPPETMVSDARLHPDGKRFVFSVGTIKRDIWILDGLKRRGWIEWLQPFRVPGFAVPDTPHEAQN